MLEIIVLIFTALVNVALSLVVYIKNPHSITNRLFVALTTSIIVWSTVNYISVHPFGLSQIVWVRLVLFCAVLLNLFIYLALLAFPATSLSRAASKKAQLTVVISVFVMVLTLTPFVFEGLKTTPSGAEPIPQKGIAIFMLYTVLLLTTSIVMLTKKYRRANGNDKNQLRLILFGIVGTFSLIVITNFLLVVILNFTALIPFGPAFTLIFSGSFAYAIVKHHLFDIRAAVARSVAYLLSLGFIGLIYGLVIYFISEVFNFNQQSDNVQRIIYVALAIVTAVLYPTVKKFFAKITTKIFYQDAYDPQEFLDNLNKILVSNVDLEPLLKDVSDLIEENIKADYCVFTLRESAYYPVRTIGTKSKQFNKEDADNLHNLTPKIHHRVLITDELDETQNDLKEIMAKYDVSVLARLVSTVKLDVEGIGYLVLGPKKSGNIYTKQDEDIIRIIANELVIAIENALKFEEIQKFNETLQEKIETATRQLRTTNEKLKLLDETKDEFISMASHQLRTPLTSVKGYLSMVLEGDAGNVNEMQNKLLNQAFVSSQRMVYLIADLLNVSRLRTGKFVIEPVATNLADVIEGESSQLHDTATSRGLTLTYKKPEKFPMLMLDETKIRQVIMNFMDNAIYYTPTGGHIDVELKETDKTVEYTVRDDGIGVPKHEQHHLFTKFYRAGNAKKARPDGTGLGLFMAKKVIVAQGGSLIFNSVEGKGSVFGFSFEKAKLLAKTPTDTPPQA